MIGKVKGGVALGQLRLVPGRGGGGGGLLQYLTPIFRAIKISKKRYMIRHEKQKHQYYLEQEPFSRLVVIVTTLKTLKNIFCYMLYELCYFSRGTTGLRCAGTITNLQIVMNTQKSLLKSSCPKKYLPKFCYHKKSRNRKFQTQKNP